MTRKFAYCNYILLLSKCKPVWETQTIHQSRNVLHWMREMEGLQPEILVLLLYLSLLYEIIIAIRRKGQQTYGKMRKVSTRGRKTSNITDQRTNARPLSGRIVADGSKQTYRHFVQMRILARDWAERKAVISEEAGETSKTEHWTEIVSVVQRVPTITSEVKGNKTMVTRISKPAKFVYLPDTAAKKVI